MRRTGGAQRNVDDIVQCGRELTHQFTSRINLYVRTLKLNGDLMIRPSIVVGSIIHIREVELGRYRVDNVINTEKLRIDYMRNRISEERFKTLLHREHIKYEKNKEIYDILMMFIQSSTDIMFRFLQEMETMNVIYRAVKPVPSDIKLRAILLEMYPLIAYVNECFETVAKTYNSVTLEISIPETKSEYRFDTVLASREMKQELHLDPRKKTPRRPAPAAAAVDYLN